MSQYWTDEQQTVIIISYSQILDNKESLLQLSSTIRENLDSKVVKKEGEITRLINQDVGVFQTQYKDKQYQRNRNNIMNIHNIIEQYSEKFRAMMNGSDDDSDRD